MKIHCIQRTLSHQFGKLGLSVAKHPKTYILSSLFFSILCGTGLQNLREPLNMENIFAYDNGISAANKRRLESLFPTNFSSYDPSRAITEGHFAFAIIVAKDRGTILSQYVIEQILSVDKLINEIFIDWDDKKWKYRDICSKKQSDCYKNNILSLLRESKYGYGNEVPLEYPIKINATTHLVEYDTLALGGVILNEENHLLSAKAVRLMYFLDDSSKTRKERAEVWEKLFLELTFEEIENITVEKFSTISINEEVSGSVKRTLGFAPIIFSLMFLFAVFSCCSMDCVRSKPWLGLLTGVSSGLSLLSGFGMLFYFRLGTAPMNSVIPFIILGIGLDDTFVMLAAWHQTDPKESVEKRLAEAFTDSGVSITITSLTNFTAFFMGGLIGSLPSISIFCFYMAACVAFDFIYQLTFVGGFMAVFGYAESQGLHSITFHRVNISKKGHQGCFKGLIGEKLNYLTKECRLNIRNINFWSFFAELLTTSVGKLFTIIVYIVYCCWCTWSSITLQEKMEIRNLAFYDSYIQSYLNAIDKYYYQYSHRLQIIIDKPIDYSKPPVQKDIEKLLQLLEDDELICGSLLTESWLRSYLNYISTDRISFLFSNYDFANTEDFLHVLKKFFHLPLAKRFEKDLVFNDNYTEVVASRFFLQTNVTRDFSEFHQKLKRFIRKAQKESPYPIIIYHPSLTFIEVIENTTHSALTTLASIIVITIMICSLLLASFTCLICVAFSILSVFLGIIGCMEPWGMHMDIASSAILIVVSGFAVDYTAHISYAYVNSPKENADDRVRYAVATYGGPVMFGSISTLLGIVAFVRPPSDNHATFSKILFLASTISVIHAVIIIPVMLSIFEPIVNNVWNRHCLSWNFRKQRQLNDTRRLSRSVVSVNDIANHTFSTASIYCIDGMNNLNANK